MNIKRYFVDQLKVVLQERIAAAGRSEAEADEEADQVRADSPGKEDQKSAELQMRLASGHRRRRNQAVSEMASLLDFSEKGLPAFKQSQRIDLGALVDVHIEDDKGEEERTLLILPVGAGVELSGPGGDGFVVVVTPKSPVGKALMHQRIDDSFEIVIDGRDREWTVVDLC